VSTGRNYGTKSDEYYQRLDEISYSLNAAVSDVARDVRCTDSPFQAIYHVRQERFA